MAKKTTTATETTIHKTLADAKAATPGSDKEKVIEVKHEGKVMGFVWARNSGKGLLAVAKKNGWTAKAAERLVITREKLTDVLTGYDDAVLAEMGLKRVTKPTKIK